MLNWSCSLEAGLAHDGCRIGQCAVCPQGPKNCYGWHDRTGRPLYSDAAGQRYRRRQWTTWRPWPAPSRYKIGKVVIPVPNPTSRVSSLLPAPDQPLIPLDAVRTDLRGPAGSRAVPAEIVQPGQSQRYRVHAVPHGTVRTRAGQ